MTELVSGEAVVLDVPCAQFPSRLAALLVDMVVQLLLLVVVVVIVVANGRQLDSAEMAAILVALYVLIVVGYPTIFETLTRGKTLGKMAIGLRVVSDDGGAVRFRQALVRGLTGAIEIWTIVFAPVGLILSMVSAKGKRLGDMFAGTYVIQERAPRRPDLPPALATVPPPLLGWAQVAEISRLSDQNAEAASSYLRRLYELRPAARDELGLRIATAVAAQVGPPPPPGTPPAAYLAAVLAIRRDREFARLASQQSATGGAGGPAGSPAAGGSPAAADWGEAQAGAWATPPGAPPPAAWAAPPSAPAPAAWTTPPGPPQPAWTTPPGAPQPATWATPPGAPPPATWTTPPSAPPSAVWAAPPGAPVPGDWPPPPSPSGAPPPPPAPYTPSAPSASLASPAANSLYTPTAPAVPPGRAEQDQQGSDEPPQSGFAPPA